MSESPRPANTVQIRLSSLGKVEVDDHVDTLDVDASGEEVGAHQVPSSACAELVEHAIAVSLSHLGMNVEARIPVTVEKREEKRRGVLEKFSEVRNKFSVCVRESE